MKSVFSGRSSEGTFPGIILNVSKSTAEKVENGSLTSIEGHKDNYTNLRRVSPDSAVFLYSKDGIEESALKGIFRFPSEPQLDISNDNDDEITRCQIQRVQQLPDLTEREFRLVASNLFFSNTEFYSDIDVFHITLLETEMKNKASGSRTGLQQFPFHPFGYQYFPPQMMRGGLMFGMQQPDRQRVMGVSEAHKEEILTDTISTCVNSVVVQDSSNLAARTNSAEASEQPMKDRLQYLESRVEELTTENEQLKEEIKRANTTLFSRMHNAAGLDSNEADPIEEEEQQQEEEGGSVSTHTVSLSQPSLSSHPSTHHNQAEPVVPQISPSPVSHDPRPVSIPLPSPRPTPPANNAMTNPNLPSPRMATSMAPPMAPPMVPPMVSPTYDQYYTRYQPTYHENIPMTATTIVGGGGGSSHWSMTSCTSQPSSYTCPEQRLAVIGGMVDRAYINEIEVFDPSNRVWNSLVQFPPMIGSFAYGDCEAIRNNLFLIGGVEEGNKVVNTVRKLDLQTREWDHKINPTRNPRGGVVSAKVGERIFLLGERNRYANSVEMFDPHTKIWTRYPHMKKERIQHDAAAYVEKQGIYVFGGVSSNTNEEVCVEMQDVREGCWTEKARMDQKREGCCGAILGYYLYVLGGLIHEGNTRTVTNTVSIFDLRMNRWFQGKEFNRRRHGARAIEFNGSLYLVGGLDENNIPCGIETFNVETNTWQAGAPLGNRNPTRVHHSVVVLPSY